MTTTTMITNRFYGAHEGFGEQYKILIFYMVYAELRGYRFVYSPFETIAHNYTNDPEFTTRLENMVGLKEELVTRQPDDAIEELFIGDVFHTVHNHMDAVAQSAALQLARHAFYTRNPSSPHVNASTRYTHIAIHVRRINPHDHPSHAGLQVPDTIYLEILSRLISFEWPDPPMVHVFSQGHSEDFVAFTRLHQPTTLHLDEPLDDTFRGMVYADVLVVAPSALSYAAGLLTNGQVYYIAHCNPPLPSWSLIENYQSPRMFHKFVCPVTCYFDSKTGEYHLRTEMLPMRPVKIIEWGRVLNPHSTK